jgi:FRG domain
MRLPVDWMPIAEIPETRVENWKALLDSLHSDRVIPQQGSQGGHYRSPFVFRGMSHAGWPLTTSLERLRSAVETVEPALLRSFRRYAPRGTFARDSDWEALAVAQHNGLPTRLLDWSVSPLVAAHFATSDHQYFNGDGVVWAVDVIALRDRVLPAKIAEPIQHPPAALFDVSLLDRVYPRLADFDRTNGKNGDICIFFEPPSIDARIANQTGILSVMNGAGVSQQRYFERLAATDPSVVHRFVIARDAKPEIRDMLDQNNIHERMLFPGLPGLCEWLRRYYGPVAGASPSARREA